MPKPSEVHYETPAGLEIGVRRLSLGEIFEIGPMRAAAHTLSVKRLAWGSAHWLADAQGGEAKARETAEKLFGNPWEQLGKLVAASLLPRGDTHYVATAGYDSRADAVAVGRFRHDVSGPVHERVIKHLIPANQFGCIGGIDTIPKRQGQGFGLATLDAGLRGLNPDLTTTVYMATNNPGLQSKFVDDFGFKTTGSRNRPEIFGTEENAEREVRLQGPAVGDFLEALHTRYAWLNNADVVA